MSSTFLILIYGARLPLKSQTPIVPLILNHSSANDSLYSPCVMKNIIITEMQKRNLATLMPMHNIEEMRVCTQTKALKYFFCFIEMS